MLKKLSVLVLAIGTSYAMEDITTTPTGDNDNIKQTVEEVKQTTDDKVNEVTDDLSILNIDKMVEQMDNIKVEENKTNDKKETQDKKTVDNYVPNKSWKEMTRFEKDHCLAMRTKNLPDDKKKLLKIKLHDKFSKSCQNFIQNAFSSENANFDPKKKFYSTATAKFGVMIGLKLEPIFSDVLKTEIALKHYDKLPNFVSYEQQLQKVRKHLVLLEKQYLNFLQKRGYLDE